MFLNVIIDVQDTNTKKCIQESLDNMFHQYRCLSYETIQKPIVIFKEIISLKDLKIFKKRPLDHHSVIFIVDNAEQMFSALEQYPLCFVRKTQLENDIQKAMELVIDLYQNIEQIMTLKMGYSYIRIKSSQITYIESLGHYLIIHTISGEYRIRDNLKHILNKNTQQSFTQIHKSFIVNESYVLEKRTNDIILKSGVVLPRGRKYKKS